VSEVEIGPGTRIDRYEIVRSVARGGMGHVWLARFGGSHGFEKLVAIKTILPELSASEHFRTMLLDEARICSSLEHANVAQILDVGQLGDQPYIVFEWVEGASLEHVCNIAENAGKTVSIGPLLRVMAEVASGLHAAHELVGADGQPLHVVHRDVTPNNIIVSRKGFAKLIDFGVAKAKGRLADDTRSGVVKGTPQYMAPEQARGDKIDRRTDIFATGAVFYRALAGKPAFRDRAELASFIVRHADPAPLGPHVPDELRAIVARAMQRNPEDRFQTAQELRSAIERVLGAIEGSTNIASLFPPAPKPGEERAPEAVTPLEQPSIAPPFVSGDAKTEMAVTTPSPTLPTIRGRSSKSQSLKLALAVVVTLAILAICALAWSFTRS
jgi:serine/threonine protein kinase